MLPQDPARRVALESSPWAAALAAGWGRRPVFLENPFGAPLFKVEDFFRLLLDLRRDIEAGEGTEVALYDEARVALSGVTASDRSRSPLAPLLPEQKEKSLAAWQRRLQADPRFRTFGLFVNRAQTHRPFWSVMREVLRVLGRHVAAPTSPLNTDIFIGNYRRTTFGVHRDRLDNLMFMVKGRRTMRLWSDAVWRARTGTESPDATFQEYEAYLDCAETFELRAGDVLYWPAETWHVGEGDDEVSISFNLDFPITDEDDRVHPIVREAYGVLVDLAANDLEAPPPRPPLAIEAAAGDEERRIEASVEALRGVVGSERFEVAVAREYLSRATAAGFDAYPAADEPHTLDDGTIIAADPAFPVRSVALHGVRIVSGCGHSRVLPDVAAVSELLDALNGGGALRASDLLDRFGDRWSEGPAQRVLLTRDVVKDLLEHLIAWRAVTTLDVAAPPSNPKDPWEPLGLRPARRLDDLRATPKDLAGARSLLRREGVAVFEGLVDRSSLAACRAYLEEALRDAPRERLGTIHAARLRFDLPLDVDSPAGDVMRDVVARLAPLLVELVSPEGRVVEFSSLTSAPGAATQVKHPDSTIGDEETAALYSVFVTLDDVRDESGPLGVWPGTHRSRFFEDEELRDRVLALEREVHVTVPAGTAVVMDSRTWHRGRANRSDRPRPVFYFSLLSPGTRPAGPTYTMLDPALRGDGEPLRLETFLPARVP